MAEAHHSRKHAQWSASATAANVHCPGRIAMVSIAPPDVESAAAAWGTACHQVAEKSLQFPCVAASLIGEIEKTERHEFTVDEEMADTAQRYVDYIKDRTDEYACEFAEQAVMWIEHKFSFHMLNPPFPAGGTGDCIMHFPKWKMIEIVDLKGGRGVVVDVKGNMQARSYALGAMLAFPDLEVETVRSTIVQPRAPHPDGRVRSEEIHVSELLDWTVELLRAMARSREAMDQFETLGGNSVAFDEWAARWLNPGKCQFCPAAGFCPALKKESLAAAGVWFDDLDKPHIGNAIPITSPEALGKTLDELEMLEEWIAAVRAHAHSRAEQGEKIPGWMLAEKIGNRAWISETAAEESMLKLGIARFDLLAPPKMKSPTQMEKMIPKTTFAKLEGIAWEKPIRGTNLVSETKTSRTRAKSKPEQMFDKLEN